MIIINILKLSVTFTHIKKKNNNNIYKAFIMYFVPDKYFVCFLAPIFFSTINSRLR